MLVDSSTTTASHDTIGESRGSQPLRPQALHPSFRARTYPSVLRSSTRRVPCPSQAGHRPTPPTSGTESHPPSLLRRNHLTFSRKRARRTERLPSRYAMDRSPSARSSRSHDPSADPGATTSTRRPTRLRGVYSRMVRMATGVFPRRMRMRRAGCRCLQAYARARSWCGYSRRLSIGTPALADFMRSFR